MAYESQTYEVILARMLSRVRKDYPNIDTREGSMMFDALAPAAVELAVAYIELDNVRRESFVNTASREYVLIACEQMGMDTSIFDASVGIHKGRFDVEVPIGSRWNCDLYNYLVIEYLGLERVVEGEEQKYYHAYKLACETDGASPNLLTGMLTAITDNPSDLNYAQLVECLIEGEDETSDDDVRQAYFDFVNSMATDGNVNQYYRWCNEYDGIGNAKVLPLWQGANTVKVSILNTSNRKASDELVEEFQNYLDYCIDKFVGDGVKTKFTLKYNSKAITSIKIDGVDQGGGYAYSSATGVVTFETAPSDGAEIVIRYEGGMGNGEAPIGAFVTVTTAEEVPISVSAKVKLKEGFTDTSTINDALTAYFSEIAYKKSTVSYMSLGAAILNAEGVDFITDLIISSDNGGDTTKDIELKQEQIGVLGTTTWTVVQ